MDSPPFVVSRVPGSPWVPAPPGPDELAKNSRTLTLHTASNHQSLMLDEAWPKLSLYRDPLRKLSRNSKSLEETQPKH